MRPKDATADENVELVHSLIMCDRRITCVIKLDKQEYVLGQLNLS